MDKADRLIQIVIGGRRSREGTVLTAAIEHDEYGFYACCPKLPGCQTQADTFEEVIANIREAAALYLESLADNCA